MLPEIINSVNADNNSQASQREKNRVLSIGEILKQAE